MDEFLVECDDGYENQVGDVMCEAYEYASNECFKWHKAHPELFPNEGVPDFEFNLDGGFKVSGLGSEGNYLQTH